MDEALRIIIDFILFILRKDVGELPYKVRLTLFYTKPDGSTHFFERETLIDTEDYEKCYSEWEKTEIIRDASDILLNGDYNE